MRSFPAAATLAALAALLAGCGSNAPAALSGPTATTIPSSLPTANPSAIRACGIQHATAAAYVQLGDLIIGRATLGALSYPAVMLPSTTPLKPMQVTTAVSNNVWSIGGPLASLPPANPGLTGSGAGYEFRVCNASASTHHTVQAIAARILSHTPFSGQLSVWLACDSAYSRQQPTGGSGCGGMGYYDETMKVTFPSGAIPGTAAIAQQLSSGAADGGPSQVGALPVSLAPGQAITVNVQMAPLPSSGTYLFAFGLRVDGADLPYVPAIQEALYAPVTHTFTGTACQQHTMTSQIPPATSPPSYYICPRA